MGCPRFFIILVAALTGLSVGTVDAKPLKKSEASRILPEGEYLVKSGRRLPRHARKKENPSKKLAAKKVTKGRTAARHPASPSSVKKPKHKAKVAPKHSAKHAAKKSKTHPINRKQASVPRGRVPVARETPNERAMPFVSIPHRKTRTSSERTIVMEDPAVKHPLPRPKRVGATLKPGEGTLDPDSESAPAEVGEAKAALPEPEIVGPAPASVSNTETAAPSQSAVDPTAREPDAFDLHSGADPMQE